MQHHSRCGKDEKAQMPSKWLIQLGHILRTNLRNDHNDKCHDENTTKEKRTQHRILRTGRQTHACPGITAEEYVRERTG